MLNQGDILRERYKVIKRLGQGGMGAVYEAHDNVFDTSVALKEVIVDVSSAADTKAQELAEAAFEREAKILAKINHETIPHVKDYFLEENAQFLVMELVDGDDLAQLLKQRQAAFPIPTLLEWTDQILDALDYLHTQNPPIIHRDIKPQNLKLTTRKKIKLLDFGIAKGTESINANTVTNQTFIAATLNYSPIEQMIRVLDPTFLAVITHKYNAQIENLLKQNADVRTDIFALGATIYHLATNKHPAEAIKRGVAVWDGNPDPLEDPRSLNPEIGDDFAEFLLKSIQISREHRYSTASEMRSALHQITEVSTKVSLTPTVQMSYDPPVGDKTEPIISGAGAGISGDKTVEMSSGLSNTESKTEVIDPDTARRMAAISSAGNKEDSTAGQTKKKRSKLLWLIPIAGVLLFLFTGAVLGVFIVYNQLSQPATNSNTELADPQKSPEETPDASPAESPADLVESTPEPTQMDNPPISAEPAKPAVVSSPNQPRPVPTQRTTPVIQARPIRTPSKPTPRPTKTPKKNMDCIFTDSC